LSVKKIWLKRFLGKGQTLFNLSRKCEKNGLKDEFNLNILQWNRSKWKASERIFSFDTQSSLEAISKFSKSEKSEMSNQFSNKETR
jgi:hypothetical protein